jgi:NAD(P) transhydrogenase subunit alpha
MANIAGYRAVIEAAHAFGRFFTGQITAAGKVPPAKVFIIGAGVAGLAAIGAAVGPRRHRPRQRHPAGSRDQIKSLGGEFVGVDYREEGSGVGGYAKVMSEGFQKAQREVFAAQAKGRRCDHHHRADPGQARAQAHHRRHGEVDAPGQRDRGPRRGAGRQLRADRAGQAVVRHGVTIIGYTDLPSRLAKQSSTLYATNLLRLSEELCKARTAGSTSTWKTR